MFDALADRLEDAWKKLRGQDKITEANMQDALKEVRRALLEADVNLQVVKTFIADVEKAAIGAEVIAGVNPGQQLIKIVYDELVKVMGESNVPLAQAENAPTVILMAGLQGTGKTTATAKLALYLRKQQRTALMVATDIYRPAAIDQLVTLGEQIEVPVFELGNQANPVDIATQGVEKAKEMGIDTVIIDTAGRLQIDEEMMLELARVKKAVNPDDTLLVVDAMTGQEAANLTRTFHDQIGVTGAILTKMDGDTRGGAALSVRQISGQPIKFVGVGEKVEALQPFYPDRMASRILSMGDVLTLVEKAQEEIDLSDVEQMQSKILEAKFDFNDFLKQMRLMKNMGSFGSILKMIPGMNKLSTKDIEKGEGELKRTEAMISSMTLEERKNPDILAKSPSRRRRIAQGSGHPEAEVSKLIKNFTRMRGMMQQMGQGGMPAMPGMGGGMPGMGGGMPGMGGMFGQSAPPGFRGYGGGKKKKAKKNKKKKGFGNL
ncbi:signal recognition particle protein [Crocosphaera subtropica ATCC 51142]|uniref:Signal recognition particle protein n=1 Tax=Crocosphaera subtropica (strain ATCC 51142 / BH68) TaxID=43989 RepID=B1WZS1_CROS5|nr:signal recognition particle protein [Crocosphaera subtropica]ACB52820.1 signal recognition particle protein [Crocosphaera subtropica ATCC 51142]